MNAPDSGIELKVINSCIFSSAESTWDIFFHAEEAASEGLLIACTSEYMEHP